MAGGRGGTPSWCTGYSVLDHRIRLVDFGLVELDARARRSLFRFEGVLLLGPHGTGQLRSAAAFLGPASSTWPRSLSP
jgi:hypothetical protein